MAKQTMVLRVPPMSSEKSRTKAMKIAVVTYGVKGVWLEKEQGKLMVGGEGVDGYICACPNSEEETLIVVSMLPTIRKLCKRKYISLLCFFQGCCVLSSLFFNSFPIIFLVTVLPAAIDLWVVKNVSGRILVGGLR